MGLNGQASNSFFDGPIGQLQNKQNVVVIHKPGAADESRETLVAGVQDKKIYFEVTSPVYIDDHVVVNDPRGGTRTLVVNDVKLFDMRSNPMFTGMSYSLATVADAGDRSSGTRGSGSTQQVFNAPVINVHGGRANLAWSGGTVTDSSSQVTITSGFEELAVRLAEAIQAIQNSDLDEDDQEVGAEAAKQALVEVTKPNPDRKLLKGFLATVRGVLSSAAGSALGGAAKDLITSLVV